MLVTLTQQSLELEDGTGKKKKQSLKVFATKNEVMSKDFFSCILMLIFFMFAARKIHAYQYVSTDPL